MNSSKPDDDNDNCTSPNESFLSISKLWHSQREKKTMESSSSRGGSKASLSLEDALLKQEKIFASSSSSSPTRDQREDSSPSSRDDPSNYPLPPSSIPRNKKYDDHQQQQNEQIMMTRKRQQKLQEIEKQKQNRIEHQRVYQVTTISAFVTFLKALFGVTLLFQPRILGETGLLLGSICHILIVGCCIFSCYLLLETRQIAMSLVLNSQQQQEEQETSQRSIQTENGVIFGVKDRLITYGDLTRQIVGKRLASIITITILVLHIMFASGMIDSSVRYLYLLIEGDQSQEEEGSSSSYDANNDYFVYKYVDQYNNYFADDDAEWRNRRWLEGSSGDGSSSSSSGGFATGFLSFVHHGGIYTRHPVQRLVLTLMLFPIIARLLQIRGLPQMFLVSSLGLTIYFIGCVGTMLYSAFLIHPIIYNDDDDYNYYESNEGSGSHDDNNDNSPSDMWEWKWTGIPAFVASTVYAIEGINLALPTANTLVDKKDEGEEEDDDRVPGFRIVTYAMILYGVLTLGIAWIGYVGGLGGGPGTAYGEDACRFISYCLGSPALTTIYRASLVAAMLLTLPVILYPSTELLEMWMTEHDEKNEQERNRTPESPRQSSRSLLQPIEEMSASQDQNEEKSQTQFGVNGNDNHNHALTMSRVSRDDEGNDDPATESSPTTESRVKADGTNQETTTFCGADGNFDEGGDDNDNISIASSVLQAHYICGEHFLDEYQLHEDSSESYSKHQHQEGEPRQQQQRLSKHWKLRLGLAVVVCTLAYIEGYFYNVITLMRGMCLSLVGFCLPPVLYYFAMKQSGTRIPTVMKIALIGLVLFGLFNMMLVAMSSFLDIDLGAGNRGPGEEHSSGDDREGSSNSWWWFGTGGGEDKDSEDYASGDEADGNDSSWWSSWWVTGGGDDYDGEGGASSEDINDDYQYNNDIAEDYQYNDDIDDDYQYNNEDADGYQYDNEDADGYQYNNENADDNVG